MASRQSKIAASQLARKLKLEKQFKPKLTRFFNQIGRDINIVWVATGNIPMLSSFEPELITILRDHYRKVAKSFSREVEQEIKYLNLNIESKQDTIDNDIMNYITTHSVEQSAIILETTRKEMQTIISGVLLNSALSEAPLTQVQIGAELKQKFIDRTGGRVDTIAITETNTVAERVKLIERNALALIISQQSTRSLVDTWNTTLDEKTRPAHVLADRQEVPHGRPFTVGGEQLRHPGDMSLGASLSNTINCRCGVISSISGEPAPIALSPFSSLISSQ